MIDITPIHMEMIKRILAEHVPDCEVRAFGSRATWTAKDYSDLDLAVVGARALDPDTLRRLKEAFEESDLPFRVDVLDWHAISTSFRRVIVKNFEVIQSSAMKSRGMAGEWRETTIGDLCDTGVFELQTGPFGSQLHAYDYVVDGIPVVPTEAIRARRIDHSVLPKISAAKAQKLARHRLQPGDILFARRGVQATGHIGCIREAEDGFICGTGAIRLRINPEIGNVDADFISHVLANPASVEWFKFHAIGATMPNLNEGIIRSFRLAIPPLFEQRAIGHILNTLDDTIELNRQMNETLEAMARALFKSWFVDFDPVRAKAEGRGTGLPKRLADAFPARLVDSELGEIPAGWAVQPFANTVEIIGGGTPKTSVTEYWNGNIPWFSVVDAPNGSDVWVVDTEKKITRKGVDGSSTRILPVGTTIISARGTVGRIALVAVPMAMNQSCYGLHCKTGEHGCFTYYATRELVARLQQHAHGSVFDTITRDTLADVSIALPPIALIEAFEIQVGPTLQRICANLFGSRTLAALRDTLLPKLISGELRVAAVRGSRQHD